MGWFNIFQIHQEFEKVCQAKTVRERTHPIKLFSVIIYANFGVIHYYFDRGYEDIDACNDEKKFCYIGSGERTCKACIYIVKGVRPK